MFGRAVEQTGWHSVCVDLRSYPPPHPCVGVVHQHNGVGLESTLHLTKELAKAV